MKQYFKAGISLFLLLLGSLDRIKFSKISRGVNKLNKSDSTLYDRNRKGDINENGNDSVHIRESPKVERTKKLIFWIFVAMDETCRKFRFPHT